MQRYSARSPIGAVLLCLGLLGPAAADEAPNPFDERAALAYSQAAIGRSVSPHVFLDDAGEWRVDERGEIAGVADRAVLTTADGGAWRLYLPTTGDRTVKESAGLLTVAGLRLRFAVSRDEEHVEVIAFAPGRALDLKARAHHSPLLVLARQRLADRAAGLPPAEAGWIHQEELGHMLRLDDNHLNICIHRARNQLGKLGIADAAALVERRSGSRQLRIGVSELEVIAM